MDRNALAELLQALESRRDAEERRREERYTALIERRLSFALTDVGTPHLVCKLYGFLSHPLVQSERYSPMTWEVTICSLTLAQCLLRSRVNMSEFGMWFSE
ncbi:UNVERIFIED_CONTAM: hypothetical protein FKN15_057683 [Acipenser sinensis]